MALACICPHQPSRYVMMLMVVLIVSVDVNVAFHMPVASPNGYHSAHKGLNVERCNVQSSGGGCCITKYQRCSWFTTWWLEDQTSYSRKDRALRVGKIFGEEPAEEDSDGSASGGFKFPKTSADDEEEEEGDEIIWESEFAGLKPVDLKNWSQDGFSHLTESEKAQVRFVAQFQQQNPTIGEVLVDQFGNYVGGVNPWEGRGIPPPQYTNPDEWTPVMGDPGGMDDPPDAPWRVEAEKIIREQVEKSGLNCYDILWSYHKLEVTVTKKDCDPETVEAGYVDSNELMAAIRMVNKALEERDDELCVLERHELIIATPGSKDVLTTDKEFKAFKGFDVLVKAGGPFQNKRVLEGKLFERTFDELIITQKGRKVTLPLALVDEVRLPPAKHEPGDTFGV